MSTLHQWQQRDAIAGLRRALQRDAPEGYEEQSQWTAAPGANDQDLMRLYRQRQQDRIDAENRDRTAERAQTGLWSPDVRQSFNMGGFYEGVAHNDQAAGVAPTGEIVAAPKASKVNMPPRALSTPLSALQALAQKKKRL